MYKQELFVDLEGLCTTAGSKPVGSLPALVYCITSLYPSVFFRLVYCLWPLFCIYNGHRKQCHTAYSSFGFFSPVQTIFFRSISLLHDHVIHLCTHSHSHVSLSFLRAFFNSLRAPHAYSEKCERRICFRTYPSFLLERDDAAVE